MEIVALAKRVDLPTTNITVIVGVDGLVGLGWRLR